MQVNDITIKPDNVVSVYWLTLQHVTDQAGAVNVAIQDSPVKYLGKIRRLLCFNTTRRIEGRLDTATHHIAELDWYRAAGPHTVMLTLSILCAALATATTRTHSEPLPGRRTKHVWYQTTACHCAALRSPCPRNAEGNAICKGHPSPPQRLGGDTTSTTAW